jgi:AraC family transcriptional regulator, transcriptional activator of pobA
MTSPGDSEFMTPPEIPVYDIRSIDRTARKDLLIKRFSEYLEAHYQHLHRPHRHTFYHFVLFTQGTGTYTIDFDRFTIKPWQLYFMVPGQVHSWHFEKNVDGYVFHFNASLFSDFLQNAEHLSQYSFFQGNAQAGVCQLPTTEKNKVRDIVEVLVREIEGGPGENIDLIRIKLLEFFILVERTVSPQTGSKPGHLRQTVLKGFQQLVEKHFREFRLPKDYAALLYVTPNHLNSLCQDLLGKTAGDLIRERILLEAKRLLTNAEMTVSEIAYDLHFADNSYFSRFFKKEVGITPETFRKQFLIG